MALRVLLADESTAIRKAVLLVLADYGPDVKSVTSGLDVLTVAKTFEPDLIIIDILLTKKNGYEVSLELKTDDLTRSIPIVLMWSNFMQLDLPQFLASKANDSIEKPFDANDLKAKVEKLLPNLKSHPFKGLLNFPRLPDIVDGDEFVKQKTSYESLSETEKLNIKAVPGTGEILPPAPEVKTETPASSENTSPKEPKKQRPSTEDDWSPGKASQFVIETESFGDEFEEVKNISSLDDEPDLQSQINEQIQNYIKDSPVVSHRAQNTLQNKPTYSSFDEQLIREEIRQIAERICWQVIPEVTEKVVREELAKLLKGIENNT